MSALTIQLPDSVFAAMMALSKREGVPVDSLFATAAAEKISAMYGIDFLEQHASQAPAQEEFLRILSKVPNNPPDAGDEW
ncbi:toxin-antitoxin system HicB family antitoxin [Prosthecobacter sp.]|uniref:toxin-antitoxin system HicB family antitoxin n=1 Tax=Prosthecobacter sp. TaxID=1965333 RepID=UPI003785208E